MSVSHCTDCRDRVHPTPRSMSCIHIRNPRISCPVTAVDGKGSPHQFFVQAVIRVLISYSRPCHILVVPAENKNNRPRTVLTWLGLLFLLSTFFGSYALFSAPINSTAAR